MVCTLYNCTSLSKHIIISSDHSTLMYSKRTTGQSWLQILVFSEQSIRKGLMMTSIYVTGTSSMSDQPSQSSLENDACIICQVPFLHYNQLLSCTGNEFQLFKTMNQLAICPMFQMTITASGHYLR